MQLQCLFVLLPPPGHFQGQGRISSIHPYLLDPLHNLDLGSTLGRHLVLQFLLEDVVLPPELPLRLAVLLVPDLQSLHSILEGEYLAVEGVDLFDIPRTQFPQLALQSPREFLVQRTQVRPFLLPLGGRLRGP
jgi:hypothetical protein